MTITPLTEIVDRSIRRLRAVAQMLGEEELRSDMPLRAQDLVLGIAWELETAHRHATWPEPTSEAPTLETLEDWLWDDGGCEATDGCWIEVDAVCEHGHPSWLLKLGLI